MKIMVPIEKECNKNSFSRCSIDKEASSLMEDEKVEVVAELAAKGLKKEQFLGRRSIIGILSFALTVLCSLSLFILIKSDTPRKILLPEKENQAFIDANDYLIYIGGFPFRYLHRTVEFNSIKNNKTCYIQPLDYQRNFLVSAVTQIGVITCGGSPIGKRFKCVRLTQRNTWETFPSMNRAHFEFDMIAMGDVLVAFGNYVFEMINLRYGKKWEIIQMDRTFWRPCVTKWDDENIIATGGQKNVLGDEKRFIWVETNETWILNIKTNTMKPGPSLNTARVRHGCTRTRDNSIIVAGGWNGRQSKSGLKSTEILKIGHLEWTKGPDLKEEVQLNEVVHSNRGEYIAYSVGGDTGLNDLARHDSDTDKIYGLQRDRNEWQLVDSMNTPRKWGSALNIPSSLIPWC